MPNKDIHVLGICKKCKKGTPTSFHQVVNRSVICSECFNKYYKKKAEHDNLEGKAEQVSSSGDKLKTQSHETSKTDCKDCKDGSDNVPDCVIDGICPRKFFKTIPIKGAVKIETLDDFAYIDLDGTHSLEKIKQFIAAKIDKVNWFGMCSRFFDGYERYDLDILKKSFNEQFVSEIKKALLGDKK